MTATGIHQKESPGGGGTAAAGASVRERGILFSAPMVRALLEGGKTQTRRMVKGLPADAENVRFLPDAYLKCDEVDGTAVSRRIRCPYGVSGDRLWVRETWTHIRGNGVRLWYRADGEPTDRDGNVLPTNPGYPRWRPSIFMARRDSRITLEVTDVRVQRLQDISEEDAWQEGVKPFGEAFPNVSLDQPLTTGEKAGDSPYRASFAVLWDEINGDRAPWKTNPWVWAVSFRRLP